MMRTYDVLLNRKRARAYDDTEYDYEVPVRVKSPNRAEQCARIKLARRGIAAHTLQKRAVVLEVA